MRASLESVGGMAISVTRFTTLVRQPPKSVGETTSSAAKNPVGEKNTENQGETTARLTRW
jgi:hypothetical protein